MEMERRNSSSHEDHYKGDHRNMYEEPTTVDWRGRPSNPKKHGGMLAASFVLGLQAFEIMAIAAVGNNLITYVINEMHFSLSEAANIVTNFIGTVFIVGLLGGNLSDSYLGCFWTILIFGFVELSGFILLSVQAHLPQLKPAKCNIIDSTNCAKAKGFESVIFFVALYLVALGSGCVKPNMIAHGADQFDVGSVENDDVMMMNMESNKKLSRYFNLAYFAFSTGQLVALTVLVWVQTHSGMDVGFGVSAAVMAMALISLVFGTLLYRNKRPQGTMVLTSFAQVVVAAILKRKQVFPDDPRMLHGSHSTTMLPPPPNTTPNPSLTKRFRFLDKACIKVDQEKEGPWRLCTIDQIEQLKTLIAVIPIFACTIIFNTILAQLQTFSVQQGSSMNTRLTKSFHVPPASLQAIPYMMLIFIVPTYDACFVPFARKITGHESGITPVYRIGFGLFLSTFSMVAAALMEYKRREAAVKYNNVISIFWITPQFLIFGLSEMFTAVGLIELFYKQSSRKKGMGMQSFLTAMTYCSYSFGFYFSSVLVSLVNKITGNGNGGVGGWIKDNDLNKDRLDLFYWLLAALSFLNSLQYIYWAKWHLRKQSAASLDNYDTTTSTNIP